MKRLIAFFSLIILAQGAVAMTVEEYYQYMANDLTAEQKVIVQQDIKLSNLLDSVMPVSTDFFIPGKTPDGEPCQMSRNRSDMTLWNGNSSDNRFFWDPTLMGKNIMGIPIKGDFKATKNTVEASATVNSGYGVAKIGLKLALLGDGSVSIAIRDMTSVFGSYRTCIFKK